MVTPIQVSRSRSAVAYACPCCDRVNVDAAEHTRGNYFCSATCRENLRQWCADNGQDFDGLVKIYIDAAGAAHFAQRRHRRSFAPLSPFWIRKVYGLNAPDSFKRACVQARSLEHITRSSDVDG